MVGRSGRPHIRTDPPKVSKCVMNAKQEKVRFRSEMLQTFLKVPARNMECYEWENL